MQDFSGKDRSYMENLEKESSKPEPEVVEKIVEIPVEKVVEKIVEVPTGGLDLTIEEIDGLLSHLPTVSERENVQSAKEKLLKKRSEMRS